MFRTLRSKLTFSYVAVALLCLALAVVATLVLARDVTERTGYESLREKKALVLPVVQLAIAGQKQPDPRPVFNRIRGNFSRSGLRVLIVDLDSMKVQVDTSMVQDAVGEHFSLDDTVPGFYDSLAGEGVEGTFRFPDEAVTYQYVAQRVRFLQQRTGQGTGARNQQGALAPLILVLAQPEPSLRGFLASLWTHWFPAVGLALLVSFIAAYFLARSISKPISRLANAASVIARGDYPQTVPVQGRDEIATLTSQFNEMAEEVNRAHQMERDFIANVSHDLKTPLTSIQGFSQAMLDGALKDDSARREAAAIIHAEADRMSRLVNQLLNLSRLQSGLVSIELRPTNLGPLLSQLVLAMHPQAIEAGVELSATLAANDAVVMADADRLKQAFGNLLDNAIKYTPRGGRIQVEISPVLGGVQVAIKDSGEGIPREELPRVMERFYQRDKARSAADGKAVGLGLAIAKEIVHAHHGQIRLDSAPGVGTTVVITLPGPGLHEQATPRGRFLRRSGKEASEGTTGPLPGPQTVAPTAHEQATTAMGTTEARGSAQRG